MVDVNEAGVALFGYTSKEEILSEEEGVVSKLYVNESDRLEFLSEVERRGYVKDYLLELKRKDGSRITVLETATAVYNDEGEIIGLRGFIRDITQQKQLEAQLLHAQKMESLGTLAGGIAHDFNNVLSMVLGTAELIEKNTKGNPKLQRYATMIMDASKRGSSIARQLLLFARSEQMQLKPISLSHLLAEVHGLISHSFPKNIEIIIEHDQETEIILGDSGHLHQAIMNLAINAKDAMHRGGVLTLKLFNSEGVHLSQKFKEAAAELYVGLSVVDTGEGISEETKQRIFEPFFSTKERGKGTGLGLAIVHGIVKSHNGFVDVETSLGKGTCFTMYFPTVPMAIPLREEIRLTEDVHGNETILVVDDEEMIRNTINDMLVDFNYKVIMAKSGAEALTIFDSLHGEVQLVISDMGMPGMTGEELFRKLRERNRHVKAIIITGYLDPFLRAEMLELGVSEIIQKPFNFKQVLVTVRNVLDGKEMAE